MSKKKAESQEGAAQGAPDFEKALARLEAIVEEMEGGKLSLEAMLSRFEEGQALVKICAAKLEQVERRIEILVKAGDKVTAKPFDESGSGEEPEEEAEAGGKEEGLPF